MKQQIKVPSAGESVTEATIGEWQKNTGDYVRQNDVLVVLETDKASMDLVAEYNGRLDILKQEGEDVKIGEVIAELDTSVSPKEHTSKETKVTSGSFPNQATSSDQTTSPNQATFPDQTTSPDQTIPPAPSSSPQNENRQSFPSDKQLITDFLKQNKASKETDNDALSHTSSPQPTSSKNQKTHDIPEATFPSPSVKPEATFPSPSIKAESVSTPANNHTGNTLSPAVRKWIVEHKLNPSIIKGSGPGGRITKGDVLSFIENTRKKGNDATGESFAQKNHGKISPPPVSAPPLSLPDIVLSTQSDRSSTTRKRMSTIRRRIAERLVQSQQSTATLTTFNEADMSQVMSLRAQYKETFQKKHNIKLGFMGFFIKATIQALQTFPRVNAFIEDKDIVYNHSCHIGVAVSTDRGLVVPVIRNADKMKLPELEKSVLFYAEKARSGKINPDDLMGGTFTISNGGVFGSLMSTPILNPPQSGILGMHKIEQRPVVADGQIVIKPMMYIALSYDHRMVDGRESVSFLLKIKECVEDPVRLLMDV